MADIAAGPATQNIKLIRGDSRVLDGTAKRSDGTIVNLTGAAIWFTAKRDYADADVLAVLRKSTDPAIGGIAITNAAQGLFQITIVPADFAGLDNKLHNLVYDVQLKDAVGKTWTTVRGSLRIEPDVTSAS